MFFFDFNLSQFGFIGVAKNQINFSLAPNLLINPCVYIIVEAITIVFNTGFISLQVPEKNFILYHPLLGFSLPEVLFRFFYAVFIYLGFVLSWSAIWRTHAKTDMGLQLSLRRLNSSGVFRNRYW